MKRASTIFLQVVLVLFGLGVLTFLILEPQVEGRNVNSTQFEIYFKDPALVYIYMAFVPFFIGLYQAIKLLAYARRNEVFSDDAVRSFRIIKICAIITGIFFIGAEAYLFIVMSGKDDIAGGVAMGVFIIFGCAVTATAAAVSERILQNAVDIKSENDLTV